MTQPLKRRNVEVWAKQTTSSPRDAERRFLWVTKSEAGLQNSSK